MFKYINRGFAGPGLVVLLLVIATSCTESIEQAASPLYDVTFTGVNVPVVEVRSTASGLQEFVAEVPVNVNALTMQVYKSDLENEDFRQEWYDYDIPSTVKVPSLARGQYNTYFSTWGQTTATYNDYGKPLYIWEKSIDITENIDYQVEMKLASGKFSIEAKEGQVFDESLFSYFIITYEISDVKYSLLRDAVTTVYGTDYSSNYNTSKGYYANTSVNTDSHYMPNAFKLQLMKLYDKQGVLVRTVNLNSLEFNVEVGMHTKLIVDIDALCCYCNINNNEFLISWEKVNWIDSLVTIY